MTDILSELKLAWQYLLQARYVDAERLAAAVVAWHPNNPSALACHALALWRQGGPPDIPIAEVRHAIEIAPNDSALRHNLSTILASSGDLEGASEQSRIALQIMPGDAGAFYGLTQTMRYGSEDKLLLDMRRRYEAGVESAIDRELLGFALAKAYDDLDQYDLAYSFLERANAEAKRSFDLRAEMAQFSELRSMAKSDSFRKLKSSGNISSAPLFVVGMPRSGTTLVESILSRHPDVLARGELGQISAVEKATARFLKPGSPMGRNGRLAFLPAEWLSKQADLLLTRMFAGHKQALIAVDKTPDNSLRLGLIAQLFPKARIVHVRRHPLDIGLSNFMKRFAHGQDFAFRQEWIGAKMRLVADSMVQWKQALDLPILDLSYEALVADPDGQSRRLVDFAGLEWSDACLKPEKTQRSVLTASQWQVRQPIYRGSVGRWKRYEAHLQPMIQAMGGMEWIETELADQASVANRSTSRS